jgi:hypothetical protein
LATNLFYEQLDDLQIIKDFFLIAINLLQEIDHSFDCERTSFIVWFVIFKFLFLEIALLNIEVQKFNDVLYKQYWIDFIDLTGLS